VSALDPRRCLANKDTGYRCTEERSGSRNVCEPCADRIVATMHRTMAHYGMPVDDLRAHYENTHAKGAACAPCVFAAHARDVRHAKGTEKKPLTRPGFWITV
jgi:hypothetical protein